MDNAIEYYKEYIISLPIEDDDNMSTVSELRSCTLIHILSKASMMQAELREMYKLIENINRLAPYEGIKDVRNNDGQ